MMKRLILIALLLLASAASYFLWTGKIAGRLNPAPNKTEIAKDEYVTLRGFRVAELRLKFYPGLTLMAAVSKAGGWTELAKTKALIIIRRGQRIVCDIRHIDQDGSNNPLLEGGDLVLGPDAPEYFTAHK